MWCDVVEKCSPWDSVRKKIGDWKWRSDGVRCMYVCYVMILDSRAEWDCFRCCFRLPLRGFMDCGLSQGYLPKLYLILTLVDVIQANKEIDDPDVVVSLTLLYYFDHSRCDTGQG